MAGETALPDLSKDVILDPEKESEIRGEEEALMDEAAAFLTGMEEMDATILSDIAERAEKLKEVMDTKAQDGKGKGKAEESKQAKKAEKPESKSPVTSKSPTMLETRKVQLKGKKAAAQKAKLAMALSKAPTSAPDIKPLPPVKAPTVAKKEVKEEEEVGATWEAEQTTPRVGDEGFPAVPVPGPSPDYELISQSASQYEELSADNINISRQLKDIAGLVHELTSKVGKLEAEVSTIKADRAQFMSDNLDRIRKVERSMGNRPPLATKASDVGKAIAEEQTKPEAGPTMSAAELMAKARARRTQK